MPIHRKTSDQYGFHFRNGIQLRDTLHNNIQHTKTQHT